jgi:hypothetical protein
VPQPLDALVQAGMLGNDVPQPPEARIMHVDNDSAQPHGPAGAAEAIQTAIASCPIRTISTVEQPGQG